jgi:hypothetical protein
MSSGHHQLDPALARKVVDRSLAALLRDVRVVTRYWVPLLGGTARDWSRPIVYIDGRFPDQLLVEGRLMHPHRYIVVHECVERVLMDELGLPYLGGAHTFATAAEQSAVEADGFSWNGYTVALRPYIALARTKPETMIIAPGLDMRPANAH